MNPDPIAPFFLGLVKRLVSKAEQLTRLAVSFWPTGHAHRHRHRAEIPAFENHINISHSIAQALCPFSAIIGHRPRQDHHKLLAAKSAHNVAFPELVQQHRGNGLQRPVTSFVSMGVVEDFEMVDINNQQRQRGAPALSYGTLVMKQLIKVAPVFQAG